MTHKVIEYYKDKGINLIDVTPFYRRVLNWLGIGWAETLETESYIRFKKTGVWNDNH